MSAVRWAQLRSLTTKKETEAYSSMKRTSIDRNGIRGGGFILRIKISNNEKADRTDVGGDSHFFLHIADKLPEIEYSTERP